jgi:hypothetical protein
VRRSHTSGLRVSLMTDTATGVQAEVRGWVADWLANHPTLTAAQHDLMRRAGDLAATLYPQLDDTQTRDQALTAAAQLVLTDNPAAAVKAFREERERGLELVDQARVALQLAALLLIEDGGKGLRSQQGFAKAAGVNRTAVLGWLGKRAERNTNRRGES